MKNKESPRPFGVLPTTPSAPFRPLSLLSSPLRCLTRWTQPHPLLSSPLLFLWLVRSPGQRAWMDRAKQAEGRTRKKKKKKKEEGGGGVGSQAGD